VVLGCPVVPPGRDNFWDAFSFILYALIEFVPLSLKILYLIEIDKALSLCVYVSEKVGQFIKA